MSEKIIALVGNPNTGKTTFFNTVAKTEEHVGNWHGVTVDYKEKKLKGKGNTPFILTDLPGAYSLSSYSYEEAVTRDYLLNNKQENISVISLCDANNLERNLLLTIELMEMGLSPIICINMANELKKTGKQIDVQKLEKMLGLKVFLINAQNKSETEQVIKCALINENKSQQKNLPYLQKIEEIFDKNNLQKYCDNLDIFSKIKILEQDEFCLEKINKKEEIKSVLNANNTLEKVLKIKYDFIDNLMRECVSLTSKNNIYGFNKLDRFVLNKWLAFPIFIGIICMIFYLTFGSVGTFLSETLANFFQTLIFSPLSNLIAKSTSNLFVNNFITQAVFGSVVSLLSFLPQIVLMFLGLYVLEDSGYMSRLAFTLEDYFKKIGLSGKSVFSLLMGFGCGTTASLTSRNMEDKNSKIKTAMLTPYISCSAKLPLYAVVCGAFFPKYQFLVIIGLYLLGVLVALLVSYFLNKTVLKSGAQSFIMELPPYRFPSLKKIAKNIYINTKQFVLRVGSVLLSFSCIVWILENCNFKFQYQVGSSILESISGLIAPVFSPLGFGNAGAVACLICGVVAKEIIVSTISVLNGCGSNSLSDISSSLLLSTSVFSLTLPSSLSFLVFALLYLPCLSTISVFTKEIGGKWTAIACIIEFAISYAISYLVYKIAVYFVFNGVISGIVSVVCFVLFLVAIILGVKFFKSKNKCRFCTKKAGCNQRNCKNNTELHHKD